MIEHETSIEQAIETAREFGVDISLLRERLRLSPTERLQRHEAALELSMQLRKAKIEQRAKDQRTAKSAE